MRNVTLLVCLVLWVGMLCLSGCGVVDPGERSLSRWRRLPEPQFFGQEIHPVLSGSCGTSSCHGREVSFRIHQADALVNNAGIEHPAELPEPIRTDYYTVLAYADAELPENSLFLLWAAGDERPHPEQDVLTVDERYLVLQWLRGEDPP